MRVLMMSLLMMTAACGTPDADLDDYPVESDAEADVDTDADSDADADADADADSDPDPAVGEDCGDGLIYDCDLNCVELATVSDWLGDEFCDEGLDGIDLNCDEYGFDDGDCFESDCTPITFDEGYSYRSYIYDWSSETVLPSDPPSSLTVQHADSMCFSLPWEIEGLVITVDAPGFSTREEAGIIPYVTELSVDGFSLIEMKIPDDSTIGFELPFHAVTESLLFSLDSTPFSFGLPFNDIPGESPYIGEAEVQIKPAAMFINSEEPEGRVHFVANSNSPIEKEDVIVVNFLLDASLLVDGSDFGDLFSEHIAYEHLEIFKFIFDNALNTTTMEIGAVGIIPSDLELAYVVKPGSFEKLTSLTVEGANAQSMNVFLTEAISIEATDGTIEGGYLGLAGGIPGSGLPGNLPGIPGNGVVVAVGERRDASDVIDPWALGLTIAHEIGHFLGLNHTSEKGGEIHDPIPDTPECTASITKSPASWGSCPDDAVSNLMWPWSGQLWADYMTERELEISFTFEQWWVLSSNPLVK